MPSIEIALLDSGSRIRRAGVACDRASGQWLTDKDHGENPDAADALRNDLQRALKGFSALRLEPLSPEVKDLRARFEFGGKTHELGWAKLSDGQRLLIALYGLLRFGLSKATMIVLDECENYVAPFEIQPWLRALGDAAAERRQQLLVVSHHPESIDSLAADGVWRMWRDPNAGHTRVGPLEPDLGAGERASDLVRLGDPRHDTAIPPPGPAKPTFLDLAAAPPSLVDARAEWRRIDP